MTVYDRKVPKPVLVEEATYDEMLKDRLGDVAERMRVRGVPFDADPLAVEPAVIAAQSAAYGDLYFIKLLNTTARAAILKEEAAQDEKDLHGAAIGVERMEGESDEAYNERMTLKQQGSSSAGPREWWLYHARSVDTDIIDVETTYLGRGLHEISLLLSPDGENRAADILERAMEVLSRDDICPDNVTPVVVVAQSVDSWVEADIWLNPDTPISVFHGLEGVFTSRFNVERKLGWDLIDSWIKHALHVQGVHKVEVVTPEANVAVPGNRAVKLAGVKLNFKGRGL